jgi:hypothetical protein
MIPPAIHLLAGLDSGFTARMNDTTAVEKSKKAYDRMMGWRVRFVFGMRVLEGV